MAKNYEELDITDDFMFGKVMEDTDLCREVLECLLQRKLGTLEPVRSQKEIRHRKEGRGIRLDIYAKDENGIYDAEMQKKNHDSLKNLDLPKRSRYYQSAIDMNQLEKNERYWELAETNIVFLCTFDPFGENRYVYIFRPRCDENTDLILQDQTVRYFFNVDYTGENIPKDIRLLYAYIRTGKAGNELTKRIDWAVNRGRKNEIWKEEYMKERVVLAEREEWGRIQGLEEGIEKGIEKGTSTTLIGLVGDGLITAAEAAKRMQITEQEFKELMAK